MRLLIDLDGVCADFHGRFVQWYNQDFNESIKISDLKHWDLSKTFKAASKQQLYAYFNVPGFWLYLKTLPDCVDVLKRLKGKGHEIVIVTSAPHSSPIAFYEKAEWVKRELPFLTLDDSLIVTHRKDLIQGDILFDDGPHNIATFPGLTCAMDMPYNTEARSDYRVSTWKEFENIIEEFDRRKRFKKG